MSSSFFVRGASSQAAPATGAGGSPTTSTASRPMSAYSPLSNNNNNASAASSAHNSPTLDQHRGASSGLISPDREGTHHNSTFLPVFNDIETHDIVIVAAGDRALSGAHSEALREHTNHGGCSTERERRAGMRAAAATMDDDFPSSAAAAGSGDISATASSRAHNNNHHHQRGHSPESHFHMEFYAHKEVLGACSVFFRAFFFDEAEDKNAAEEKQQQQRNSLNGEEPKSPCRRLVVHNVLPASLAHILQSMYGAYTSNTTHNVNLYDPVSLASAPPSVIICAWELAMKLELRTCAASIVHLLIPTIDEYNALELLKATTKYEGHELSIVLQRACLHARALPPAIETESDRRLWQELCCQIPWLSSAVAHLEDDATEKRKRRGGGGEQHQRDLLSGRRRAAELLSQRRKARGAGNNNSRDADDEFDGNDDGADDQRSIGESTQRAWDETASSLHGEEEEDQQQQQRQRQDDGLVQTDPTASGSDNGDEHADSPVRKPPQSLQQPSGSNNNNAKSRLTPRPLSSAEALCLHNDRTASATGGATGTATTTAQAALTLRSGSKQQQQQQQSFIPAGSAGSSKLHHHHYQQQHHVDPSAAVRKNNSGTMADALQSRDPIIRVTATRTVLRDAMSKSGAHAAGGGPSRSGSDQRRAAMPPTADLPFVGGGNNNKSLSSSMSPSRSNSYQQQQQDGGEGTSSSSRFVQRTLPDFEQRFVQSNFGDHRKVVAAKPRSDSASGNDSNTNSPTTAAAAARGDTNTAAPTVVARHKIASLEKDIQNTYDIYSREMAEYRSVYEALRKETTELWASTGLVDAGNVPSSVEGAESMLSKIEQEDGEEARQKQELEGAIAALVSQAEEEQQFSLYAEQFMQAAGIATQELGSLISQVRDLVAVSDKKNNNNRDDDNNNNNKGSAASDSAAVAERKHSVKRTVEILLDETLRRVADEDRETEAKLRAHEITLQQLLEDVSEEQRKTETTKIKLASKSRSSSRQ